MKTLLTASAFLALLACGLPANVHGGAASHDDSNGTCEAASDCSGALPFICEMCADGTSSCAHWICASNACQTSMCENNGGPEILTTSGGGTTGGGTGSSCDPNAQPAACPGGGAAQCQAGSWICCDPALGCNGGSSTTAGNTGGSSGGTGGSCDPNAQPAACPGGGSAQCQSGSWVCCDPALGCNAGSNTTGGSTGGTGSSCDPNAQPAACPGGVAAQCQGGSWICCDPALGCTGGSSTTGGGTGGSTGGTGGNACQQSSDCGGPLPQLCEVCADGNQDCDHWDCVNSSCQISICENDGGQGN